MTTLSPARVPLPSSPSTASRRSSNASTPFQSSPLASPRIPFRPRLDRNYTSATVRQEALEVDPFSEGSTISVNQPVGSLSISPCSRDVCLASRKGLYILDLANLHNAPRFIPQGGTWQIADCQWSPHPPTANLILSTSSQKLLVWDLAAQKSLHRSVDAHARAITDINWHALNPHLMATVSMDAGIRGWDLRCWERPYMRLCAWGAAGTQVKWNRQHEHILATSHGNVVHIWDDRKGSVPITTIQAHSAKIYGIDWDRRWRHKLVTCSLDKTIKYWNVPELATSDSRAEFYSDLTAPDEPTATISTNYPVWRARNLPFGHGVLALPQRGERALEMFSTHGQSPVERFEGHDDVVKDFVWRVRGGDDANFDDRDFQLVSWSKDRTLRIWPISREIKESVGFKQGAPIKLLVSRRGAPDVTYTKDPSEADHEAALRLPPPLVNAGNITRQKMSAKVETGMTRGGNKTGAGGMDQLDWLTKVVKNAPSPDSSAIPSRSASVSRARSRGVSVEGKMDWISLKDEVVLVNQLFPRPKINFEKIDLAHRRLTISMLGPWANGDRMAFLRIHWTFPANYPYGPDIPLFELERNPTVSPITRSKITGTIKEIRSYNRQCLVATTGFLLGSHERVGRRMIDEESDSESDVGTDGGRLSNVPMLIRTCGATFGPNGQLVCFFPKQVVLPRTKVTSRSPSITRDLPSPMAKALSALQRLQNPHQRNSAVRYRPRLRRLEQVPPPQIQAGSTVTIHDISRFGQPSLALARVYTTQVDNNLRQALEAKRLDHVHVWSTLRSVLEDPDPPPAYSALPSVMSKMEGLRRDRQVWEQSMLHRKRVLDQMLNVLIAEREVQLLALISCILLDHSRTAFVPAAPEAMSSYSPEQDYFTLPRMSSHFTPTRQLQLQPQRSSFGWTPTSTAGVAAAAAAGSGPVPISSAMSPGHSSYRTSGWSQILNPSGISLRGAITPRDRTSFGDLPFAKTPLATSYEDSSPMGLAIPSKKVDSPKIKDQARGERGERQRYPTAASASPTLGAAAAGAAGAGAGSSAQTPLRSSGTDRSMGSVSSDIRSHKVSFGSASPLGKGMGGRQAYSGYGGYGGSNAGGTGPNTAVHTPAQTPSVHGSASGGGAGGKKRSKTCSIRIDFPNDESPPPSLLPEELKPLCEAWKLAYADWLLRMNILFPRTELLAYQFISFDQATAIASDSAGQAANGQIHMPPSVKQDEGGDPVGVGQDGMVQVCMTCSGGLSGNCPCCDLPAAQAMCAYCRLPIKGLSMSCSTCGHKLHSKCFKSHFLSTLSTPLTCPACTCSCLAQRGIATPSYTVPMMVAHPTSTVRTSPSVTRGFARGTFLGSPNPSKGLMDSAEPGLGGLGFSPEGQYIDPDPNSSRERERTQSRDNKISEGLLARARWGGEGLLHWKAASSMTGSGTGS